MDFALPELGEGLYEAELVRWLVQPGDAVKRGQPLLEVMTDKATMEVPAPFAGKVSAVNGEPGARLKVGQTILSYQLDGAKAEGPVPVAEKAVAAPVAVAVSANGAGSPGPAVAAAPSVRHLARKLGIDLGRVRGSGPAGRILLDDLAPLITREGAAGKSLRCPSSSAFSAIIGLMISGMCSLGLPVSCSIRSLSRTGGMYFRDTRICATASYSGPAFR